ncbi:GNAT family N-acetyltransferase [Desulfosporosinus nitroreducens]|uniref:GNAT family N-acetyltransferase n=1 Tax=Desulfosporosinus nitroreducens TaxID=2018668 RepID=A0ABT8QT22_9FIRM|nr:GNAT family N-acetyltransferase [Desulfosporosinus nitroreducens]MCO1602985.1 GNAT family N-acetyltransferase [Desulfosporosinus nitroreducens]MDO0823785.1 GNAT family N-acetyltransferase [Desulfosporosinus nitroreducens]
MCEIRLARKGETDQQKEIWKLCFGDPDSYIDFYFANRYKEDETVVLLHDGEIAAMLTMIPVRTVFPDDRSLNTAMFYAIATHPKFQNRGFATQLMDYSNNQYLRARKEELSVLVPAHTQLFEYYRKQGYQDGLYIREILFSREGADSLPVSKPFSCTILPITSEDYNRRRNSQLNGRLYISYPDENISYQKKLSQLSGADIYAINIDDIQGCLAVERITSDKVLIKEILLPDDLLNTAVKQIVQQLTAKEYVLRTSPHIGQQLGGSIRPFGMIRVQSAIDTLIMPEDLGYLGVAFD